MLLPVGTALSGTPRLFVDAVVTDRQGNAAATNGNAHGRLLATLWDCATTSDCTEITSGHVDVNNDQDAGPQLEDGQLTNVDTVLAAGHTLRLTVELDRQGNATAVTLRQGGDSGSRLELTTVPSVLPLAGLGLAALLLLGGFAARRK